ncbi:senescence-associated carboxylesterase 101-like [Prosopis cineraria]|uniref:senescence-associated carboxylesterase 101-like n=1 Tax=Prosopis cineraria TaxID=364024 RepID=UPI00240F56EA|nr:senescence-associated carboxylesterase 101-like [Prosopis cineraria]
MTQNQSTLFSSGLELASFVASSDLLTSSCKLISDLYAETHSNQNLFFKIDSESGLTVIAFGSTQNHAQSDLLPFSIDMNDNPFKFICSKTNPKFSLNQFVFSLFNEYRTQLGQLKSEIDLKKPVIVTGHAVGGSIASLFTLLLLGDVKPIADKRPLCITFGSPLLGDQNLQHALSQSSYLNSCFLHVISLKDPCLASPISDDYRSFGIFLLCSDHGSACFENPDSILKIQKATSQLNQRLQIHDYGNIVGNLNHKAICKDYGVPNSIPNSNQLKACLSLQLCALGFPQLQQEIILENLVEELQEVQKTLDKRKRFVPNTKLDDMKINMACLEWYKKEANRKGMGYYDCSKMEYVESDQDIIRYRKELNLYWEQMVEEVEKQPQKEGAAFRTRWLFAGTNYRRMVEPLDIACYYKEGKRDYIKQGRSEHYKLLEKWMESDKKKPGSNELENRQNVRSILTLDSCFWAHVEEALISSQKLKAVASNATEKQEAVNSLDEFEKYVYGLLKKYAVSPEIFLEKSSFMRWWKEYYTIKGASHDSELASFMKNPANYDEYEKGAYDFR